MQNKIDRNKMTEIIDRYLNQLNSCLNSSSSNRGSEAADICSDLRAYCIENITETQIGELTNMTWLIAILIVKLQRKLSNCNISFLNVRLLIISERSSLKLLDVLAAYLVSNGVETPREIQEYEHSNLRVLR